LVSHFEGGTWTKDFSERVLKKFGRKKEGDVSWRKLHNDELRNLYFSLIIVGVIKSRRM
jgi:hypothetical protein